MSHPLHRTKRWRIMRLHRLDHDLWRCQWCGVLLKDGRTAARSAVVDHLQPAVLRPDLFFAFDNLRSCCKACHDGGLARIEAKHEGDAAAILEAKRAWRPTMVGLDGYPLTTSSGQPPFTH